MTTFDAFHLPGFDAVDPDVRWAELNVGDIALRFDPAEGSFSAWYYEHRFPICPFSYPVVLRRGGPALDQTSLPLRSRRSPSSRARLGAWPCLACALPCASEA